MVSKACYVAAYRQKLVELAHLGVDLTLVVPPYWQFAERRAPFEPGRDDGYRIIQANPIFNGRHHLHFYPQLPRLIADAQPDLVHLDEEPYDLVTYLGLRAAERARVLAVFFSWQNLDRRFPAPFSWIERYVLRHAAGGQAGNREAAAILRRKGFRGELAVIPQFGIDPAVFRPADPDEDFLPRTSPANHQDHLASEIGPLPEMAPSPQRTLRIGYLGRLVPEKGLWVLLDAVAGLAGEWQLELVGSGPLAGDLERAIRDRGLAERARLRPPVASPEVPALLRRLDLLVLPSLTTPTWKEQFGRVLIEAMGCGVAVIGSDSGEIPNVVGEAGLIVPEGDPARLRAALAELADPPRRQVLIARGLDRVRAQYTQRRIAEATRDFYDRVLSRSPLKALVGDSGGPTRL